MPQLSTALIDEVRIHLTERWRCDAIYQRYANAPTEYEGPPIGHYGVPRARCRITQLRTKRTMVTQYDAYATKDFAGGRPCAYGVDKQISHGGSIGEPQFGNDNPKIGPPRLQFRIRHEPLCLT